MEKVTLGEGILSALFIAASIIRFIQNKNSTEAIKQKTQTTANSTIIRVDDAKDVVVGGVKGVDHKMDAMVAAQFETNAKMLERFDAQDRKTDSMSRLLEKVCTRVGVEWKDEITIIKGPKKP